MTLLILKSLIHISKEELSSNDRFYTLNHPEYGDVFFYRTGNCKLFPSVSFVRIFKNIGVTFQRINFYSKIENDIEIYLIDGSFNIEVKFQDYTDIELVMINGRGIIDENVVDSYTDQFITNWRYFNHLENEKVINIGDLDE